jgi:hypothetical protein
MVGKAGAHDGGIAAQRMIAKASEDGIGSFGSDA